MRWSKEELEYIQANFAIESRKSLAERFNKPLNSIHGMIWRLEHKGAIKVAKKKNVVRKKKEPVVIIKKVPAAPKPQTLPMILKPQMVLLSDIVLPEHNIVSVKDNECRYPTKNERPWIGMCLCGQQTLPGRVYCSQHEKIVWRAYKGNNEVKKPLRR